MQVGAITIDGRKVGLIAVSYGTDDPDLASEMGAPPISLLDGDAAGVEGSHGTSGANPRHHSATMRAKDHPHGTDGAHLRHHSKTLRERDQIEARGGAHLRHHTKKGREEDQVKRAGATTLSKSEDPRGMEGYIRSEAVKNRVDPDIAVRVAKSEGLRDPVGDRGQSHGAFQLYKGGGLGNEFQKQTGLDPADPKNEKATIAWALKNVGRTGWEPYHGAKRVGISNRQGINVDPRSGAPTTKAAGSTGGGDPVSVAEKHLGENENRDTRQLAQFLGADPRGRSNAWCARFVNASLRDSGGQGTGSGMANSFQRWGSPVADLSQVKRNDVLVKSHGHGPGQPGGHVGFATGETRMKDGRLQVEMLSGNISDSVGKQWENSSSLMARRGYWSPPAKPVRTAEKPFDSGTMAP